MKLIIFALACVAIAAAVPVEQDQEKILRSDFDVKPDGAYSFGFETEKGIRRQEEGQLKEVLDEDNKPRSVVVVRGEYSYPNVEGKPETVSYYADESGYHAEGDSIPKPVRK